MNVLAMMRQEFNVDSSRIYLMGHSMGGCGTYYLSYKHPGVFAALGTMAPANQLINARATRTKVLEGIRDLPVICFQGALDTAVPAVVTREWVNEMKQMGMACQYNEIYNADHFTIRKYTPEIIEFFNSKSKTAE